MFDGTGGYPLVMESLSENTLAPLAGRGAGGEGLLDTWQQFADLAVERERVWCKRSVFSRLPYVETRRQDTNSECDMHPQRGC